MATSAKNAPIVPVVRTAGEVFFHPAISAESA